jgi:hypothetical protein
MNTYIRDDGVVMLEASPNNFVRAPVEKQIKSSATRKQSASDKNALRVFEYLEMFPDGLTADECAHLRESDDRDGLPKVNSVAPVLSVFKSEGITHVTGRRKTRSGSAADVHSLTQHARSVFMGGSH